MQLSSAEIAEPTVQKATALAKGKGGTGGGGY